MVTNYRPALFSSRESVLTCANCCAQVHGRLLQARLLLETNAPSATAAELALLADQTAAALAARLHFMRAGSGSEPRAPAAVSAEYLRTAAALFDVILKPRTPRVAAAVGQTDDTDASEASVAATEEVSAAPSASAEPQVPGVQTAASPAVASLADAVLEGCRALVTGGSETGKVASTDAADPMHCLFLKEAALLAFGPSVPSLLKQQPPSTEFSLAGNSQSLA